MLIQGRPSNAADELGATSRPLVFQRQPIGVGRVVEVTRSLRCDWTEPQPRGTSDDFHRVLDSDVREKVLATNGSAVTGLSVEYRKWRETRTCNAIAYPGDALDGRRYLIASATRVVHATSMVGTPVDDGVRSAVEADYAALGSDEPAFGLRLRPLVVGDAWPSLAAQVGVLLGKHAGGPGAYAASYRLVTDCTLARHVASPSGDGGEFAVRIQPSPDPTLQDHLWVEGRLVLNAQALPLAFTCDGRFDRRVFTRAGEVVSDGRFALTVKWTYA